MSKQQTRLRQVQNERIVFVEATTILNRIGQTDLRIKKGTETAELRWASPRSRIWTGLGPKGDWVTSNFETNRTQRLCGASNSRELCFIGLRRRNGVKERLTRSEYWFKGRTVAVVREQVRALLHHFLCRSLMLGIGGCANRTSPFIWILPAIDRVLRVTYRSTRSVNFDAYTHNDDESRPRSTRLHRARCGKILASQFTNPTEC